MWTLSGFSDEISPDPREQCQVASGLGLKYVEIRSAWNVNILDLDADQLATLQQTLKEYDLSVSSIGSPIGKIIIDEDFEPHLERMRHAADGGRVQFGAPVHPDLLVLHPPRATTRTAHRDEVLRRMRALADVAEEYDVVLLHENEKEIYGDIPRRCLDIVTSVDSPKLRLAWDAANFVQVGVRPFTEGYAAAAAVRGVRPDQGRPPGRRLGGGGRRGRRRGRGDHPRAARRRLRRLLLPRAPPGRLQRHSAASPAPSCGPAPGRRSPTSSRPKGSSSHDQHQPARRAAPASSSSARG